MLAADATANKILMPTKLGQYGASPIQMASVSKFKVMSTGQSYLSKSGLSASAPSKLDSPIQIKRVEIASVEECVLCCMSGSVGLRIPRFQP